MKLKVLKSCIDRAWEMAGGAAEHVDVEVWLGKKMYRIKRVGQFGVIPDVTLTLEDEEVEEHKT